MHIFIGTIDVLVGLFFMYQLGETYVFGDEKRFPISNTFQYVSKLILFILLFVFTLFKIWDLSLKIGVVS